MTTTAETGTGARLHDPNVRGFASDNYSGVHPEVLAALAAANDGHQVSYGEDDYTARLHQVMVDHFGPVPLKTGKHSRPGPKWSTMTWCSLAV